MRKTDPMKLLYAGAAVLAICLFVWGNASFASKDDKNERTEEAYKECERRGGVRKLVIAPNEIYMICKDNTRIDIIKPKEEK